MNMTVSKQLAQFVGGLHYEDLPMGVAQRIKTLFLHGLGVGLGGYDVDTAALAIEVAKKEGPGKGTIIIDGSKVTLTAAAFANGAILCSRGQEDDYHEGMLHPGVSIIPAALAVSEEMGCRGKDLIVALASGFEVAARLSKGFCQLSTARGFRSSPIYGVFGAAAAASKLMNLSEEKIGWALGWSANLASGLIQMAVAKTPEMPIQSGLTGRNGIFAARLGEAGTVVAEDMLEGERGFYKALCGSNQNVHTITQGLGQNYWMMDTFQKRYPAGGSLQTPLFAMLSLLQENNLMAEDIESIEITLPQRFAQYPGINSLKPGLISAQYGLAVACVHKKITLTTMSDLDNAQVINLMRRVTVKGDEKVLPPSCELSVRVKNKGILSKDMHLTHKDHSYSFDETKKLIESFIPEMAVPEEKARKMMDLIAEMEAWKSVDELMEVMKNPGRKSKRIKLPS